MIKFLLFFGAFTFASLNATTLSGQNTWIPEAYQYLQNKDADFELTVSDFTNPVVTDDYISGGIRHIYFNQQWDGIPIYNRLMSVTIKDDELKYVSHNYLSLEEHTKIPFKASFLPSEILSTASQFAGLNYNGDFQETINRSEFKLKGTSNISSEEIYLEKTYEVIEDQLIPAWLVGIFHDEDSKWWQYHIHAETSELLNKTSWTIDCKFEHGHCDGEHTIASHYESRQSSDWKLQEESTSSVMNYTYEVFGVPLFSPLYGGRTIESTPWSPALNASPFGWHDDNGIAGDEYTTTRGNNVRAVEDADANNSGGYSPDGGSNLDFQFPLDLDDAPEDYLDASITNLFYWNNMMHDIFYQYGFDEASGNFQENNYGNGGQGSDMVNADAQDGSGTGNANFSTPPDGGNPRMQMFKWNTSSASELEVMSPSNIAGSYFGSFANFGPTSGVFSGELVEAIPALACSALTNASALDGKIAVIDRGDCTFVSKVNRAQDAGAIAVIICNNISSAPVFLGGNDPGITIPSIMLSMSDCATLKAEIPTVQADLILEDSPQVDSDLDNGVIAHEYGHGISIRLTGGPGTSNCLSGDEQMGEGWSDYFGLITSIEPGDIGETGKGVGSYLVGEAPTANGIRTYPYSTDIEINQHTYDDIKAESVPHGVGTVWGIMLWEMTWGLISQHGFDPDLHNGTAGNNIAMALVIEGMKLQPCNPGFVDGRDAILAADDLLYGGANNCIIWRAFAKRGLGLSADQGSSNSRGDGTEAFDIPEACGFVDCYDGIQNGDETGIDCGGINCNPCDIDGCVTDYASANALSGKVHSSVDFETNGVIETNQLIGGTSIADYDSALEISLEIGFEIIQGADVEIFIDGCNNGNGGNN